MSTATQVRLGLFTLLTGAALVAVALALGWSLTRQERVAFHTYFDETVQGLEIGAPVRYRGVQVGTVKHIDVAPDRQLVEVELSLLASNVKRLGLENVPPNARTQLGTQGITGVKYVDIDFFDPKLNPPPVLGFTPGENYIPAAPSLLKGLADNLEAVGPRLPKIAEEAENALASARKLLDDLADQRVATRLGDAFDEVDQAAGELRRFARSANDEKLASRTGATVDDARRALAKLDAAIERLGGEAGVLAGANKATDSIAELGRTAQGSAEQLPRTLRDVDEAAQALREFLRSLERDPAMLVKGPAAGKTPAKVRAP